MSNTAIIYQYAYQSVRHFVASPREDLEKELIARRERVLVLAGAGVACATDTNSCASWLGLLEDGLRRCRERCHTLTDGWLNIVENMIAEKTVDDLIDAASRIEKKLRQVHDGEFGRWLSESVGALKLQDRQIIDALLSWGTRIATTNYDNLFEDASGLQPVVWDQGEVALQILRGDHRGILHLHGHYLKPDSVVFGATTYTDICRDERAQNLLRSAFTLQTIIFVGCGAGNEDPNFGTLFEWSKEALGSCIHTHYHLVRQSELTAIAEKYKGLRITPVSYGEQFSDLGPFLSRLGEKASHTLPTSVLESLATCQSDYDSQRKNLESQAGLSPLEYARRNFELARFLWDAGGRRTAALHMASTMDKCGEGLAIPHRIDYLLQAAEYLLWDDLDLQASALLHKAEKLLSASLVGADTNARFHRLVTRCLSLKGDLATLEQVIQAALATASENDRARLEAQMAEFHMLNGDLTQAETDLEEDG